MIQANSPARPDPLQGQRETIRRGLARANIAAGIILLIVVGLALVAILAAYRAERKSESAAIATQQVEDELWKAFLSKARAIRLSGIPGRRSDGLAAVAAAAKIRLSTELRNEAIALLALTDLDDSGVFWPDPPETFGYDFDHDIQRYVRADTHGGLHIHRLPDNAKIALLTGPESPALVRAFSPDGKFLTARYLNGEFWIWDLERRATTLRVQLGRDEWNGGGLDISLDSRTVAVAGYGANTIYFFDLTTGAERKRISTPFPSALALHPTEAKLGVVSRNAAQVLILSLPNGEKIESRTLGIDPGTLAWSRDGRFLAAGCPDNEIVLWDEVFQKSRVLRGHRGLVGGGTFNPAGTILASRSWDGTSRLWDVATGESILTTHRGAAQRFSRDNHRLGFVREGIGVGYWSVAGGTTHRTLACAGGRNVVFNADFSPDGEYLAASKSDGVYILETHGGTVVQHLKMPPRWSCPALFQPDGKSLIASGQEGISIWPIGKRTNGAGPELLFGPGKIVPLPGREEVSIMKPAADGKKALAALSSGGGAVLVDLEKPERSVRYTNAYSIGSFSMAANYSWLAMGTRHGTGTRLYDPQSGAVLRQLDVKDENLELSPDGSWLIGGAQDQYVIWNTRTWKRACALPRDANSDPSGPAAFSGDSRWIAIKRSEKEVDIVDPATGKTYAALEGPVPLLINNLGISSDGMQIAIAGNDEIQLWNLRELRAALRSFGLDWFEAGRSVDTVRAVTKFNGPPGRNIEARRIMALILVGVVAALVLAGLVFRRNRQLIRGFAQVEAMVVQRTAELEIAQSEIVHSQKMKALGTLAAGIAHDFNNLLSVIRMSNDLIEEARTSAAIKQNTAEIEQAVQQGKTVVRSMLGYSRETLGDDDLYGPGELVNDLLTLLSKQFLGALTVECEVDPDTPSIRGNRNRIEQILLNLVVNAADAMQNHGKLRLTVGPQRRQEISYRLRPREAEKYVEILVADTGQGIDAETLPRIFEPFFTTKQMAAAPGTGLGLSIVYRLAEADGLGISLETGPSQGTTFRITIPVN